MSYMNHTPPARPASRLFWLSLTALALVLSSCEGPGNNAPPTLDGSVPIDRTCSRPAAGCPCEPGDGPVSCTPLGGNDDATCRVGEMYCRGGQWSGCESVREFEAVSNSRVGGVTAALVGDAVACDACSPDCADVTTTPDCADVMTPPDGVTVGGDIECDPGGGITVEPGPTPPLVPVCVDPNPPGGSYDDFCAGTGSMILIAADPTSGVTDPNSEICADQLAADTFRQALCSCDPIAGGAFGLTTATTNTVTGMIMGNTAHVYTNGEYQHGGQADIEGSLVAAGTGNHTPGGRTEVTMDAMFNGNYATTSQVFYAIDDGDMYVNGNVSGRQTTVNGGAGSLFHPSGTTVSTTTSAYVDVTAPVVIDEPCTACDRRTAVDIAGFIAAFKDNNDNVISGRNLDPTAWASAAGGNLSLPCGRFFLTEVNTSNSFTLTAEGRTALFIEGDLRSGAQLTMNVDPGAEIDVFVGGTIEGGASINLGSQTDASRVRVYVAGSDPIVFSGNSNFGGNVYAPNAEIQFGGTVNVYGSFYARRFTGTSNVKITYDEGILDVECPPPASGSFTRVYDSAAYCGSDLETRPDWGDFTWDADVPDDTEVSFIFRTAESEAELLTASPVYLNVPPNVSPINVGDMLVEAGLENFLPYLSVEAFIQASRETAPLIRSFDVQFECGTSTSGVSNPSDYNCSGSPIVCQLDCVPEICDDGISNDCDGDIDCADPDCNTDPECANGEICGNGFDDDADGLLDFWDLDDCPCGVEVCDDGLDNDADTLVDCADPGQCSDGDACNSFGMICQTGACVCPSGFTTESSCGDTFDNDCDGLVDCADFDCAGIGACTCGNNFIDVGETCDDGAVNTATCNADCTTATCGDTYVNPAASEDCDGGGETAACDADCTFATCGDLTVNATAGEACDDGGVDTATCNADCTTAGCGDGYVNAAAGESCDDGAAMPNAFCIACVATLCGNGTTNVGEDCDDAGETGVCDADCTFVRCGDGYWNATAGETCDDGNLVPGDGCDGLCQLEPTPILSMTGTFNTDTGELNGVVVSGWDAILHVVNFAGTVEFPGSLVVTGSWPFIVNASVDITVSGTIDASGGAGGNGGSGNGAAGGVGGTAGPGANAGGAGGAPTTSHTGSAGSGAASCGGGGGGGTSSNNTLAGGGGGAGASTAGTAGGAGDLTGGTAGATSSVGCGGGGGGAVRNNAQTRTGGGGGGGGGVVELNATGVMAVSGSIDVSGGDGGSSGGGDAAGGGGGSGGSITLTASVTPTVVPGALYFVGGLGGGPRGGDGADGASSVSP